MCHGRSLHEITVNDADNIRRVRKQHEKVSLLHRGPACDLNTLPLKPGHNLGPADGGTGKNTYPCFFRPVLRLFRRGRTRQCRR